MTPFEFVFALISVVTSLALTKIITGVVSIIRHEDRHDFSLTHALWIWVAFAVVLGNWAALWTQRTVPDWHAFRLLSWLLSMTSIYAFCALVIPDFEQATRLSLKEFHERESHRYIIAHNIVALMFTVLLVEVQGALTLQLLISHPVIAFALGTVAFFTRGRVQLAATILLALLVGEFLLGILDIVSSGPGH
jgi:hypothetical protein